ncbi:MAG: VWA domain-containing protein [Treponema sp.]|uniref:VWA domain-containing protein n=1 Tax=Treponema sp. TaxID=166 RepID=UPI00257A42C2|nr:VWA domain-containing protein [Treponema sp.]MBQ9102133.1 VWA domain-containing protein [Treponema sp.]
MNKNQRKSRRFSRKALERINEIIQKYPSGISDIDSISEEARAWIEKKIQQTRECLKNVHFPSLPSWWETLRLSRNKTAHQTEDFTDEEFSDLSGKLFLNIQKISADLNSNINRYHHNSKKKGKFENFASASLGSESERKQLVDAMEDMVAPIEPKDIKIKFPKNNFSQLAENTLSEILSHDGAKEYVGSHEGLSENIQTDILEWLQKTQSVLEKENPFLEEAVFIQQQKKLSAQEIASDLASEKSKIHFHYKRLPSVSDSKRGPIAPSSLNFDFYEKEFIDQKKTKKDEKSGEQKISWKSVEKIETLHRNFINDMEQNLIERKNMWEQNRIDEMRKAFLEELYKKIDNFIRLEKLLSPFIKTLGHLWDLSESTFETSGFEILEQFLILLDQDESLRELAELLGKQTRAQSLFEKEIRDKVVIKSEWHPKPAYRGEIDGLRYSNDISSVLPSELALLKNTAAKKLFQLKFAQKQLLSFKYQNDVLDSKEENIQEETSVEKQEPKGPIIICVDTSGSMHGTPENIAKTITFALSKIAIEEERKCYLISFSTSIETLDLTDFSANPIGRLVQFLRMSFHGGTDATPALKHAVKMLSENKWKNADVLMISDFVMQSLDNDIKAQIKSAQENNTNFHSLVIGTSGNNGTINNFNHNWVYDVNNPQANRHLVEQIHEIRTHNSLANA